MFVFVRFMFAFHYNGSVAKLQQVNMPELPQSVEDVLRLPSLALSQRSLLPDVPGVYLAVGANRVLYIGQSVSLKARWTGSAHHRYPELNAIEGLRLYWYEVTSEESLREVEAKLIERFNPPVNNSAVKDLRHVELESQIAKLQAEKDLLRKQIEVAQMLEESSKRFKEIKLAMEWLSPLMECDRVGLAEVLAKEKVASVEVIKVARKMFWDAAGLATTLGFVIDCLESNLPVEEWIESGVKSRVKAMMQKPIQESPQNSDLPIL